MSTATLERESATDRDPGPRRLLHGMTWLVWRQHRGALWTGLALVAALVVTAVLLRNGAVAHQAAHGITGCPLMGGPERCSSSLEAIEEYRACTRPRCACCWPASSPCPSSAGSSWARR